MKGCIPLNDSQVAGCVRSMVGQKYRLRNVAFFLLGCLAGFRISEILSLKVGDVVQFQRIVERVTVQRRQMKNKRESRTVLLHPHAQVALFNWITHGLFQSGYILRDHYVFQSRASGNRPITSTQAYRILKDAFADNRITGPTGTHCMRKTFAKKVYEYYLEVGHPDPLRATMEALGHTDIKATMRYLESVLNETDKAIKAMDIRGIEQEVDGIFYGREATPGCTVHGP